MHHPPDVLAHYEFRGCPALILRRTADGYAVDKGDNRRLFETYDEAYATYLAELRATL